MTEILASVFTNLIVAGPLVCGLFAAWVASRTIFQGAWIPCIILGIVTAILVGFVIRPLHKEKNPHRYAPKDYLELGPKPNGSEYRP